MSLAHKLDTWLVAFSAFQKYFEKVLPVVIGANPNGGKTIYSHNVPVNKNTYYNLGIACKGNQFFLYLNEKLLEIVEDEQQLRGQYAGVIASGKGER